MQANGSGGTPDFLVFALLPDGNLNQLIKRAKSKTHELVGPQTYLHHPPHLTLYVAAFGDPEAAAQVAEAWCEQTPSVQLKITGWHHFGGDVLTGKETLVCQLAEEVQENLRSYQTSLIEVLSELRDGVASRARYAPHFDSLSDERKKAVEGCGFPFIGRDWIAHMTIGSIHPDHWDTVWSQLQGEPPVGQFHCPRLAVFRLQNDDPVPWKEYPLDL